MREVMKKTKIFTMAVVTLVQAILILTPAQGQHFPGDRPNYDRSYGRTDRDIDRIIWEAYRDILQRDPDSEGLRYYRSRLRDYGWTEKEVREDLWKSHEYGRQGTQMTRREAERIVRRAYLDVLGREPDPGSRPWVDKILVENWTEQDLVRELRNSDEYRKKGRMTRPEAERIVRRVYLDVLGREPDPGSRPWVDKIQYEHWTDKDLARELRRSDEYRQRVWSREAEQIVRQAYLEVLGREPDPASRVWVDKVLKENWTKEEVVRALRDSDEYRRRHR
jgi:RNase P/RNase MRP subunit POP5